LPHVGLAGTVALTVLINLIMASAFASIMLYAMELMPGRIGLIGGVFYGLNFALGGLAAAFLGALADRIGLHERGRSRVGKRKERISGDRRVTVRKEDEFCPGRADEQQVDLSDGMRHPFYRHLDLCDVTGHSRHIDRRRSAAYC
jgi:uncharacterized membrane protein